MKAYSLFVEYLPLHAAERRLMPPVLIEAQSDEEAARMATAIAEVVFPEMCEDIVIRLVNSSDDGRLIGECRRPVAD
jgi:hypothetical protein